MKRLWLVCIIICIFLTSTCLAEEYDLQNMTAAELNALRSQINAEIKENHEPTSAQESSVKDAFKAYVEDFYGTENVSWAWIDYTYSREWDFFTIKTHADIKKQDGGKAQYDLYGELYLTNDIYEVVYVQIGTEAILDQRSEKIADARVLGMLGLGTDGTEAEADTETEAPMETEAPQAEEEIIAKRGDKNETVKTLQQMLIRLGYLSGSADGDFGGKTETAVMSFQKDNGMAETGTVTQSTYDAIEKAAADLPEPVEYPSFTAKELYAMYDKNEIAADAQVKDVVIEVNGKISTIGKDFLGNPYVALYADSYGFETVNCYFSKNNVDSLASLSAEDKVTIRGECTGFSLLCVVLEDCELVG